MRQGLKKYSNWPTFPQLYANGTLVGGLDIIKELDEGRERLTPSKAAAVAFAEEAATLATVAYLSSIPMS